MNWQVIKFKIYWWSKKIILNSLYFLVVFLVFSFSLLQFPSVQTALTSRMLSGFSQVSGFDISYDRFYLLWYDRLEIEGLKILDPKKNIMIGAERLQLNFTFSKLWAKNEIHIDGATVRGAQVNLVTLPSKDPAGDLNINLWIDEIKKQFASNSSTGGRAPTIHIGEVILDQASFSYNDTPSDSIKDGFDYNHFRLGVPDGEVENFQIRGDTIQLQVRSLVAQDQKTKLNIKELKTFFRFSQKRMEFLGLNLKAGRSVVTDTVVFSFNSTDDFKDFNKKVSFSARLKGTVIHPADLSLFAPLTASLGQPLHLSGDIDGKVSKFNYRHMRVGIGTTLLTGQLEMDGLPLVSETFINLNLRNAKVTPADIRFLFSDEVFGRIQPLGTFQVRGDFVGYSNDFVANGNFDTRLGTISSDINLKTVDGKIEESAYRGNLALGDFDLGAYFQDTVNFQRATINGQISGKGLTETTANFILNGKIKSVGLAHYNYTNITTDAQFARQLFNGKFAIDDPHLKFNISGSVDFRKGHEAVNVKGRLDTAFLQALHLTKEKMFISSFIDIDTRGLQLDSLLGSAFLKQFTFIYRDDTLKLDSIQLISSAVRQNRKLALYSTLLDINLEGNYYYSALFKDVKTIFHEFYLNLRNDKEQISEYYSTKIKSSNSYDVAFQMNMRNVNPLFDLADLPIRMSKNVLLDGKLSNGFTSKVHAYSKIDTLFYEDKIFLRSEIELSASKVRDSSEVLGTLTINSARQDISKGFKTRDLLIEAVWNGQHVDLGIDFDQDGYDNLLRLKSEIDFLPDSTRIKIMPSRIKVLDQEWTVSQQNYMLVQEKEITVHHLEIYHDNEAILLDGQLSVQPEPELKLSVSNLNLKLLNSLSTQKFTGIMNGVVNVRDIYHVPYLQNNISIKDLTINTFLIGNITGTNQWNQQDHRFDINFFIDRLEKRIINLGGFYDPEEKTNPLQLKATLENANLKIAEPFLQGIFSQLDGTLTGSYEITGTFSEPKISGEGKIADGQIMIDYLRTLYLFTGTLATTTNKVIFKDFNMTDVLHNKATVKGFLEHDHFSDMRINLDASFRNFQVLNTTAKDNELFYGQGYATGNLNILGPIENMKITANARSQKNTKIFIPIKGSGEIEKKDFINFTRFTDSIVVKANLKKPKEKVVLSGITMDLNLDITPDAFAEIIFDIKSGDIIRGRGNGNLKLQLDTKGEFNMFGLVEFTEGAYNFTLYDIINKEFSIKKGSRISWFGDPYQATMNITASYRQLASLGPILRDQSVINDPVIKRRYPIEVLLKLEGPMLAPQITFDIDAKDLPTNVKPETGAAQNFQIEFNTFKARLDEQELKKQVFSLIILRKFAPYGESVSTSGSIAGSVSELFSNQLGYWLSQVDQNLEINLDLKGLDQEAFNTFQLRLSYSFLNGRLRVTRDGSFNNQYNRSDISTIAGDWTVDYLLTPDGMFKVKMYSRANGNSITNSLGGTQAAVTTGVSLMYTQNFNQFMDLLRSSRQRAKKKEEERNKNNPEAAKDSKD